MYTNPSNISTTLVNLLDRNADKINSVVMAYQGSKRKLMVLQGTRNVVLADAYPIFVIEPGQVSGQWATTRSRRPRYSFRCTLSVKVDNERYGVEYVCTLGSVVAEIMTSPENLQLPVYNEAKWDLNDGLLQTHFLDSEVDDANFSSSKSGSIRQAEFGWTVTIHEPYPESKWKINGSSAPTVIRPVIISE